MRIVKVNAEIYRHGHRMNNSGHEEGYSYWSKPEPTYINPSFIFGVDVEKDTVTFRYGVFPEDFTTYRVKRLDFDKFCDYIDLTEEEGKSINNAMKKVIEAANTKCDISKHCPLCEYNDFCEALRTTYKLANKYYRPDGQ